MRRFVDLFVSHSFVLVDVPLGPFTGPIVLFGGVVYVVQCPYDWPIRFSGIDLFVGVVRFTDLPFIRWSCCIPVMICCWYGEPGPTITLPVVTLRSLLHNIYTTTHSCTLLWPHTWLHTYRPVFYTRIRYRYVGGDYPILFGERFRTHHATFTTTAGYGDLRSHDLPDGFPHTFIPGLIVIYPGGRFTVCYKPHGTFVNVTHTAHTTHVGDRWFVVRCCVVLLRTRIPDLLDCAIRLPFGRYFCYHTTYLPGTISFYTLRYVVILLTLHRYISPTHLRCCGWVRCHLPTRLFMLRLLPLLLPYHRFVVTPTPLPHRTRVLHTHAHYAHTCSYTTRFHYTRDVCYTTTPHHYLPRTCGHCAHALLPTHPFLPFVTLLDVDLLPWCPRLICCG